MLAFLADAYSVAYGLANSMLIRLAIRPAPACSTCCPSCRCRARATRGTILSPGRYIYLAVAIAINTVVLKAAEGSTGFLNVPPLAFLDLRPLTESPSLPLRVTGWLVAALESRWSAISSTTGCIVPSTASDGCGDFTRSIIRLPR